jgi:hypothetical protein
MARALHWPPQYVKRARSSNLPTSNQVGILVGGAQNQKLTYEEKHWPHLKDLIELILAKTNYNILLFGAPETLLRPSTYSTASNNLIEW